MESLSPKDYGLNAKVRLIQSEDHIGIVIDRKSRIIMKDGIKILDQAEKEFKDIVFFIFTPLL